MGKFNGKTLLMLGSNIGATDIINYAKANGAYTIAADYYPTERSAAKRCADLALQISTNSLDELSRVIEEHHVNGVLAGISEFNLLNAMELSRRHHLPFYCTRAQWDMIESKDQFRRLCEENGVPCPKTYFIGKEPDADVFRIIRYPAVLKPVDACASAGVHICRSEDDLKQHISDAQSCSRKGDVIIEEFVTGNEFTAHYVISNGKAALACVDNRYPAFRRFPLRAFIRASMCKIIYRRQTPPCGSSRRASECRKASCSFRAFTIRKAAKSGSLKQDFAVPVRRLTGFSVL